MRNRQDRLWQAVTSDNSRPHIYDDFLAIKRIACRQDNQTFNRRRTVYCEVRNGSLNFTVMTYGFRVIGWGICGAQRGSKPCFSPSTSVCPCHYHFTNATCSSSSYCYPYQKDKRAKIWEPPQKQCSFGNQTTFDRKSKINLLLSLLKIRHSP
jgi:hypothetical protein